MEYSLISRGRRISALRPNLGHSRYRPMIPKADVVMVPTEGQRCWTNRKGSFGNAHDDKLPFLKIDAIVSKAP